ncbi:MAG: Ig-like domain-containing protein [Caldilineaceae bacterium]
MTTAQNVKLPVTLKASDESSLKYVIVGKPANGTLSGTGANLVYQPGTDFFGVDSFSFKADDGDATSNLATVTINVTPTPGQGVCNETASWSSGQKASSCERTSR